MRCLEVADSLFSSIFSVQCVYLSEIPEYLQVGTQHSTLDCSTAVLQSVHHAAGRVCSGKVAAEPTTISDAENQEGSSSEATLRRHALHSQPPLHNPSHAKSRGEARAITEQDTAAQQPKLLNRLNKVNVNITFAGADSRSSKVLPCNWAEDVVVRVSPLYTLESCLNVNYECDV